MRCLHTTHHPELVSGTTFNQSRSFVRKVYPDPVAIESLSCDARGGTTAKRVKHNLTLIRTRADNAFKQP